MTIPILSLCMLSRIRSGAIDGLSCLLVDVEVDISYGQSNVVIVGLADTAIQESKERIRAAMKNAGLRFPWDKRVVVNLAPADVKKEGPIFDLPICLGILQSAGDVGAIPEHSFFIGELSLDGRVRPVKGILAMARAMKEKGCSVMFVPEENVSEAGLVEGIEVCGVPSLQALVLHLTGKQILPLAEKTLLSDDQIQLNDVDFNQIKGQSQAKRALEIAAAGGHNILMSGSPGAGKSMLAKALPSILPPLTVDEWLEVATIYSVVGLWDEESVIHARRPFRSPHHSASSVALVGGGRIPMPGEITLSHRGVLFLDEFPEFPRTVLETLRQPMEDGVISIARSQGHVKFPARFMLVAAQNPCPCGFRYDPDKQCVCTTVQFDKYKRKISGPLLDRIDLCVQVPKVAVDELDSRASDGEASYLIRGRVIAARNLQLSRLRRFGMLSNAEMTTAIILECCVMEHQAKELLKHGVTALNVSARGYFRIIKVAQTIADLAGVEVISEMHIAEALQYRFADN